jgi:hypothetical protein
MGTPYAISSDLVSAYPAKSLAIAQYIDGYKTDLAMVQNAQTGVSYSLALADFTKLVTFNNASAVAVTLPLEATVAWEAGTQLRLLNIGAGTVTVAGAVGVTINGTPLTLGQFKGANLIKTGTNTWVFIPFASGIAQATVTSTTGSPTITTVSGKTCYLFTGSGSITNTAGLMEVLAVGGAAGGAPGGGGVGGGGGGAGGHLYSTTVYIPAGTTQIYVGAGGSGAAPGVNNGSASGIGVAIAAVGGGQAGTYNVNGSSGGSGGGGGATNTSTPGGTGFAPQGNDGGVGSPVPFRGGGGGGSSAVGATGLASGNGGAGTANSITGTSVTRAGGGGGSGPTPGTGGAGGGGNGNNAGAGANGSPANSGGGGGGGSSGSNGGNGASGVVILLEG